MLWFKAHTQRAVEILRRASRATVSALQQLQGCFLHPLVHSSCRVDRKHKKQFSQGQFQAQAGESAQEYQRWLVQEQMEKQVLKTFLVKDKKEGGERRKSEESGNSFLLPSEMWKFIPLSKAVNWKKNDKRYNSITFLRRSEKKISTHVEPVSNWTAIHGSQHDRSNLSYLTPSAL